MFSTSGYSTMKNHFNELYRGAYKKSNGLEMIRNIYKDMFSKKIGMYDVYESSINTDTNPVDTIVSLVGPRPEDYIPSGLIRYYKRTGVVNIIPNTYLDEGITKETFKSYINIVYNAMNNIVRFDNLWLPDREAADNPFSVFIKSCPFYFTFHHAMECIPEMIVEEEFKNLLLKNLVSDDEEADAILNSISGNKCSNKMEDIYKIMTVSNSVDLFRFGV